ncbi:hypothetical protein LINPERPRIM_LOCUS9417 [Linum perenne]
MTATNRKQLVMLCGKYLVGLGAIQTWLHSSPSLLPSYQPL